MPRSKQPVLPLLKVRSLTVDFEQEGRVVHAVRGIDFDIMRGECLAIVGESGSGKSQSCMALMGLLEAGGRASGQVLLDGEDLLNLPPERLAAIRGRRIGMIFQDPLTALTPHIRVGEQIAEGLRTHRGMNAQEAWDCALHWLERVRIPEAASRMRSYPHELSGGMRQRVMIASAMACQPDLLIADEPTTALDATVQSEVLEIMAELMREQGTALLLITHDMGVVARLADKVYVMKDGGLVEQGAVEPLFREPRADYTRDLLAAVPRLDTAASLRPLPEAVSEEEAPILSGQNIKVHFPVGGSLLRAPRLLRAVDGVDLELRAGETLGVVGESGCGKSTLARAALRLIEPSAGSVTFLGRDLSELDRKALRAARRDLQIVFQDPFASLDPRMTIGASIAEPLLSFMPQLDPAARDERVRKALEQVGLPQDFIHRYPHQLSGGQNQRAGIARATIMEPRLVICDEAVSALDVTVQARIIDLLITLQDRIGMAILFISHDLAVVRQICHRVMVMYLGRVVEEAPCEALYADPRHPYTRALLAAALWPDPAHERHRPRARVMGEPPSPFDRAAAFRYLPSRLLSQSPDEAPLPELRLIAPGHRVAEFDAEPA